MSVAIVNVLVPVSGDGPIANVAAIVGAKTVILSGRFSGRYVLLASHDDVEFVPVANFDSGGDEGIEQTVPGSYKSFRLRAQNPAPSSPVSCEVSGVTGQNYFTQVASFPPGAGGTSAVVDTYALFPPTGLEEGLNFICTGIFRGSAVVEGSLDGVDFNPIGSFRADSSPQPSLLGGAQRLEFSPLLTLDKVRYLQVRMEGTVTATTAITFGGSVPISSAPGASALPDIIDGGARSIINDGTEQILFEYSVNFDAVPVGTPILPTIIAVLNSFGNTITLRCYLGATNPGDTTGATLFGSTTTATGADTKVWFAGAPLLNPGGKLTVQITGQMDPGNVGVVKEPNITW